MTVDSLRLRNYAPIDVTRARPLGYLVYIRWEIRNKHLLGGKLVLPDSHRGTQFTGKVLKIGDLVPEDYGLKEGQRVMFMQFSGFKQHYDEKQGRIALVDYESIIQAIPDREDVEYGEEDFNYDEI